MKKPSVEIQPAVSRLQEGTQLQVADIDSARMMLHIRHGKGAKDRYVPLPERTLLLLRQYSRTHRNPLLLSPAEGREGIQGDLYFFEKIGTN